MTEINKHNPSFLRITALVMLWVGLAGSLYFMFNAGRHQKSIFLITLFTLWVGSPFAGLLVADKIFNRSTDAARRLIYWLMIGMTIVSLAAYSGVLNPPEMKPAFIFLVGPLVSWILILIVISISRKGRAVTKHEL